MQAPMMLNVGLGRTAAFGGRFGAANVNDATAPVSLIDKARQGRLAALQAHEDRQASRYQRPSFGKALRLSPSMRVYVFRSTRDADGRATLSQRVH